MILELTLAGGLIAASAAAVTLAIQRARADVARAAAEGALSRAAFELDVTAKALAEAKRRNSLLAEALSAEINRNPNADLPADDVASRLRRLEVSWSTDGVSAQPSGAVPDVTAAAPPDAGELPAEPATELR